MKPTRLYPSALPYLELCPGFTNRDGENPRAERGSRLHELVETDNADGARTEYEEALVDFCGAARLELIMDFDLAGVGGERESHEERKIKPHSRLKLPISSCKVDYHTVDHKSQRILVVDYKFTMSGHNAREDVQGWTYALVLATHYFPSAPSVPVTVAFIDAEKRSTSVETFTVDAAFRGLCRTRIEAIYNRRRLHLAGVEGVKTPGRHCRFCALLGRCPSSEAWVFPIVEEVTLGAVNRNSPIQDRLRVRNIVKDYMEAVTEIAKEAIVQGAVIPGFTLEPKDGRDKVGSLSKFLLGAAQWIDARNNTSDVVADQGDKLAAFGDGLATICKPSKGEVVKLVGKIFGKANVEPIMAAFVSSGAIVPGAAYEELVDHTNETKEQENA